MKTLLPRSLAKLLAVLLTLMLSSGALAQTYTTVANGNWNATTTWSGGVVPPMTITSSQTVNIRHNVTFNLENDLTVSGKLNITGGTLQFPAIFTKKVTVTATGQLLVLNGSFLQSMPERKADLQVDGGRIRFENAMVRIGRTFSASAGTRKTVKNSTLQISAGYTSSGSTGLPVYDTVQYSTVEASLTGNGHFETKDYTYLSVANANLYINDGDFKVAATASIKTLSSAYDNYGFNKLKIEGNLANSALWDARVYSYCISGDMTGLNPSDVDFVRQEDCALPAPALSTNAGPMVLNEVYTDPNPGNHEFFELYNFTSYPESLDNYTLVTFFKNDTERGFYVLDMPNQIVEPKSFFVGAAAFPFNVQSQTNSLAANFSWNAVNNGNGTNGKLTKWVHSTVPDASDGNLNYNMAAVPATGFNDLFNRITGDNSYTMLLYKNGTLVNRIIAGAGGSNSISTLVTSMPTLMIDMLGNAPDFLINFSSLANIPVEAISSDAGTDNGFIRETDGACGSWKKSSSSASHTPLQSNGNMTTGTVGSVSVSAFITKGTTSGGSTVSYTITATSSVFPVELRVYTDNGSVPGQFDVNDTQVDTKSATLSGQTFTTTFHPYDADILIVVRQASGCIDHIKFAPQPTMSTLPVTFQKLTAALAAHVINLKWQITDQEEINHFIVQRSTDQRNFKDIAYIFGSTSVSEYEHKDRDVNPSVSKYYYRIKAVARDGKAIFSNICLVRLSKESEAEQLIVYPMPFNTQFTMVLPRSWQGKKAKMEILSSTGAVVRVQQFASVNNSESVIIEGLPKGTYIVNISTDSEVLRKAIVKN